MITIGVLMGSAYADDSQQIVRRLCSRAKERGNVNLIFFPGILDGAVHEGKQADACEAAVSIADALIISDQAMLQMLLEQPEGAPFSNVLERIPYMLINDDAAQAVDHVCALAQGREDEAAEDGKEKQEKRNAFEAALEFAVKAHKGQVRKGSSIPYIVHPIETALIAMTLTSEQDIIIAALFHDIIEDTPYSAKEIEDVFGSRVAQLVQAESENKRKGQDASQTWKIRKQEFIDSLDSQSTEEKMIALADKLSNMRATYQGCRKNGEDFWKRFHEKRKEMHHWYYRAAADKLKEFQDTDAWKELDRLITEVFESGQEAAAPKYGGTVLD